MAIYVWALRSETDGLLVAYCTTPWPLMEWQVIYLESFCQVDCSRYHYIDEIDDAIDPQLFLCLLLSLNRPRHPHSPTQELEFARSSLEAFQVERRHRLLQDESRREENGARAPSPRPLEIRAAGLQAEVERLRDRLREVTAEAQHHRTRGDRLQEEVLRLHAQAAQQEAVLQSLRAERDALTLARDANTMGSERRLTAQVEALSAQLNVTSTRVSELSVVAESARATSPGDLERLEAERHALDEVSRAQVAELRAELSLARGEGLRLAQKCGGLEEEVRQLTARARDADAEREGVARRNATLAEETAVAARERDRLSRALEDAQEQVRQVGRRQQQAQEELAVAEARALVLQREACESDSATGRHEKQLQSLKMELELMAEKLKVSERENARLAQENKGLADGLEGSQAECGRHETTALRVKEQLAALEQRVEGLLRRASS